MESIFEEFYNIPIIIRMICKSMSQQLKSKFANIDSISIFRILSDFIFKIWLFPQFEFSSD